MTKQCLDFIVLNIYLCLLLILSPTTFSLPGAVLVHYIKMSLFKHLTTVQDRLLLQHPKGVFQKGLKLEPNFSSISFIPLDKDLES